MTKLSMAYSAIFIRAKNKVNHFEFDYIFPFANFIVKITNRNNRHEDAIGKNYLDNWQ